MEYEVIIQQTEKGLQNNADRILELVNSKEYKKYKYVVTTENYDEAIKDKKALKNKYEDAKRNRIDFEKKLLDEWKPIKDTLMKAEKIVKGYIDNLDAGINTIEDQEKELKKEEIHAFYIENLNELQIPFEKVFVDKWLNKTCTKKAWQKGMKDAIANYELEYSLLERSDVEDKELLKSIFMDTWNRLDAFSKYDDQMAAKKRADELRKSQETKQQEELEKQEEIKLLISEVNLSNFNVTQEISEIIDQEIIVNEMVSIKGNKNVYENVRSYALSLGLTWEAL